MIQTLDKIDRRILFELEQNSRVSESELAKKTGKSREAMHYRIKQMEKSGVISGYSCFINLAKMGYQGYKIYLKTKGKPERKREFIEQLKKNEKVFWIGLADGAWDIGLTFFAKNNDEFYDLKNKLFSEYKDTILEKTTGSIVDPVVFGNKFLLDDSQIKPAHLFGPGEKNELDNIDLKIIKSLLKNSRMRLVGLARETKSTVDIMRGRMKNLEKKGIIKKYFAVIDHNKLEMEYYKSFLYFDSLSQEDEKKLYEFATTHPNIVNMVRQITPWDIELEIIVENYQKYNRIINKVKEAFPETLRNVESAIMIENYIFPAKEKILSEL